MKNLKRFIAYFVYIVLIGCFIVWTNTYKIALKNGLMDGFQVRPVHYIILTSFPIIIGLLLSLPRFILIIQKPGVWKFDWVKFIAVGFPSFLALIAFPFLWTVTFMHKYMPFLFNNSLLSTAGGIIFGYVLLSAFEKVSPSTSTLPEDNNGVPLL